MTPEHIDALQAYARLVRSMNGSSLLSFAGRALLTEPLGKRQGLPMSKDAALTWRSANSDSEPVWTPSKANGALGLIADHAIPIAITLRRIVDCFDDREAISEIAEAGQVMVWITKDEDARLNAAGLRRRMPEGWLPGGSVFARYDTAGIELAD